MIASKALEVLRPKSGAQTERKWKGNLNGDDECSRSRDSMIYLKWHVKYSSTIFSAWTAWPARRIARKRRPELTKKQGATQNRTRPSSVLP